MKLMNWFKGTKAKAFVILGSFAMLLGVGASIYSVTAAQQNEVVETKADTAEKGTIYIAIEDQKNGWNDNQYFGCDDKGNVLGISIVIKSVMFADGSNYTGMSQIESGIISGRVGGALTNNGNTLTASFADGGWGDNVHNFSIQLPWIVYSITYNYVSGVNNRAIYSADMTATAGISYKDFIYHDGWDADKGRPYHKVSHTTTGYSNEQVDYKPAKYFDADISTDVHIYTEDILYWTYYDPTAISVDVDHRTFVGWYNSETYTTQFTGPFIWHEEQYYFYGKYEYEQYAITYKDKGGTTYSGSNLASLPSSHTYNTATTLVNGAKEGYRFDGWFIDSACTGTAITTLGATDYTAAITLYAKWTVKSYTLTWNFNGGTPSGTYTAAGFVNYGTTLVYPSTVTKTGYTFSSWSSSPSTMPASNLTITANFSTDTFAIVYNKNGGASGTMSNTPATYNASVTLRENGFTAQSGFAFQEWNTAADGSGYSFSPGSVSATDVNTKLYQGRGVNRTLYAIWTSGEEAAATYASGFNSTFESICVAYGSTDTGALATAWAAQANAFYDPEHPATSLPEYVQWWLLDNDRSEKPSIVKMLKGTGTDPAGKYDYIFAVYGTKLELNNFLRRSTVSLAYIVAPATPNQDQSPLTLTLWIVLGAGILGMGAIGTAYFVSKKKKRHQA